MTALAQAAHTGAGHRRAAAAGTDRTIRVSTAAAVLAVAGVAAYVSYWHAYAVVRAHGESGMTARLEPATIDGLVYASSMVILYTARHGIPVPRLPRWLLALGIAATLGANMAQGWSSGPAGAVVAAWPAVSLVGSYELLVWMIRTAATGGPDHAPAADPGGPQPDQPVPGLRLAAAQVRDDGPADSHGRGAILIPGSEDGPYPLARAAGADQQGGPVRPGADHAAQGRACPPAAGAPGGDSDVNAAAVATYRASLQAGTPLSERKLAATFGKTSRRWARHRIAEARQATAAA